MKQERFCISSSAVCETCELFGIPKKKLYLKAQTVEVYYLSTCEG